MKKTTAASRVIHFSATERQQRHERAAKVQQRASAKAWAKRRAAENRKRQRIAKALGLDPRQVDSWIYTFAPEAIAVTRAFAKGTVAGLRAVAKVVDWVHLNGVEQGLAEGRGVA